MAHKRTRSESPKSDIPIYKSSKVEHGQCIFIGAYSPSLSTTALQRIPEFRSATHRIAAWRKPSRQKSLIPATKVLYDSGHDDDGERWAGSRLQNVLNDTQIEGVVVVARWFGGQNIGPIRFTHIENCAKEAIWNFKTASKEAEQANALKKQKIDDEMKRQGLISNLQERDSNIVTLRKLLAEKKAKLEELEPVPPTPQKMQDYAKMDLKALERVDKARDKTVAFVLAQIDKVEEELKLVEALEDGVGDGLANGEEMEGENEKSKSKAPDPSTPK